MSLIFYFKFRNFNPLILITICYFIYIVSSINLDNISHTDHNQLQRNMSSVSLPSPRQVDTTYDEEIPVHITSSSTPGMPSLPAETGTSVMAETVEPSTVSHLQEKHRSNTDITCNDNAIDQIDFGKQVITG